MHATYVYETITKAISARAAIQSRIVGGAQWITYGQLMQMVGADRQQIGKILDWILKIDIEAGSPLWCSFVCYSNTTSDHKKGDVNPAFFDAAAKALGITISTDAAKSQFLFEQRMACVKSLEQSDYSRK
jgi:hypothetical protein